MLTAIFKVGDQQTASGKEHLGLKDGMLVDYFGGKSGYNPTLSDHMKKVFCIVKLPGSWENDIIAGLSSNYPDDVEAVGYEKPHPAFYRRATKLVTFNEIGAALGIGKLDEDLRSSKVVDIIDGTSLSKDILKSSDNLNPAALDLNLITAGSYTVGSDVLDVYPTLATATGDFGNFTGDLDLTQTSIITEITRSLMAGNLNGHKLTITSDNPDYGDPTAGHIISFNIDGPFHGFNLQMEGPGTIELKNLYMKRIREGRENYSLITAQLITTGFDLSVHDILMDGAGYKGCGFNTSSAEPSIHMYNMKVWDFPYEGNIYGIRFFYHNAGDKVENCTVRGCYRGIFMNNIPITIENCVSIDNGTDFVDIGSATGNNNASSDATAANGNWDEGANNQPNITPAIEFVTEDDTHPDFLKLTADGVCHDGGTAPSIAGNTAGIRGNARPHGADYSIGADEFGSETGEENRNYPRGISRGVCRGVA